MRIYVKVAARASKNEVEKISDQEYKVKVTAPPVKGEANKAIIKLLSSYFDISKSSLNIVGGKTAKTKIIDIE